MEALWLEDGGSLNDIAIFEALSRLSNLRRLCLFNFAVGPKLGQALRKLIKLERVFVLPVSSQQVYMSAVLIGVLQLFEKSLSI